MHAFLRLSIEIWFEFSVNETTMQSQCTTSIAHFVTCVEQFEALCDFVVDVAVLSLLVDDDVQEFVEIKRAII